MASKYFSMKEILSGSEPMHRARILVIVSPDPNVRDSGPYHQRD